MVEYWVIPPKQDAEFVADMEQVLETYALPYDPEQPVVCMDEQPVQLVLESQAPCLPPQRIPNGLIMNTNAMGLPAFSCLPNR